MRLSKTLKLGLLLFLLKSIAKALGFTAFRLLKSVDVTAFLTGAMESLNCRFWIQRRMEIYNCLHFLATGAAEKLSLGYRKIALTFFQNLNQNGTNLSKRKRKGERKPALLSFHTVSQVANTISPTVVAR